MDLLNIVLVCAILVSIVIIYKIASINSRNRIIYASTFARNDKKVTIKHNKRKKKK